MIFRHPVEDGIDPGEGRLGVARQCLTALRHPENIAQQAQGRRRAFEATVDQDVRDAGLALNPIGLIDEGVAHGAEVENQVGLQRQHALKIGFAGLSAQTAHAGQTGVGFGEEIEFLAAIGPTPAEHAVRRHDVEGDGGRPTGGEYALDAVRNDNAASGTVDHCAFSQRRLNDKQDQDEAGQEADHRGHSSPMRLQS